MPDTSPRLTDQEIYALARQHIPPDFLDDIKERSYRAADVRHTSHRAILSGLLLKALRQFGILTTSSNAAV